MDSILIGTNGTSYTITDATRVITLSGLPSITQENLLYVFNYTQNKLYYAPTENIAKVAVSGGDTLTVDTDFAVLASTDELHIQLSIGDLAYDYTVDANKDLVQNPEWAHYTSTEHLIDVTDASVDTYFKEFYVEGFRNVAVQIHSVDATGFEWKIYLTIDDAATEPATGGTAGSTWIEVTNSLFGAAQTGTAIDSVGFMDTSIMPLKYLVEYTNQNATNTIDCWIRKY